MRLMSPIYILHFTLEIIDLPSFFFLIKLKNSIFYFGSLTRIPICVEKISTVRLLCVAV